MATTTENLGLKNPSYEEMADIGVINDNMEIIDKAYGGLKGEIANVNEEIATNVVLNTEFEFANGAIKKLLQTFGYQFIDNDSFIVGEYYNVDSNKNLTTNTANGYKRQSLGLFKAGHYYFKDFYSDFTIIENHLTGKLSKVSKLLSVTGIQSGEIDIDYPFTLHVTTSTSRQPMFSVDELPTKYIYGVFPDVVSIDSIIENSPKTITVGANGDYTKFSDAVKYSNTHKNTTIYVEGGVYDLITELGSEYFDSIDGTFGEEGLQLGENVHIIFASNAKVVCHYTGDNDNVMKCFSPFSMMLNSTGFTLENLNIECSRVRYCVHDENLSNATPYRNIYKNCRMVIDNSDNTAWNARQCIGGGLGKAGEIVIENCYFESVGKYATDIVSYHNGSGSNPFRSNISITGCYFANEDGVRCSHYGNQTDKSLMIVSNCSLGRAPRVIFETSDYSTKNFELLAWNNVIRS